MKKDEQSTALVAVKDLVQGDETALAILNDESMPEDQRLAIVKDMNKGVEEMMEGIEKKLPVLSLGKDKDPKTGKESPKWFFQYEEKSVDYFTGIILWSLPANSYFHNLIPQKKAIDFDYPSNTNFKPPFCTSVGGIKGSKPEQDAADKNGVAVKVFGNCGNAKIPGDCWLNKFGSSPTSSGKACANKKRIVMWKKGGDEPFILTLSTMSVPILDDFLTGLSKHKPHPLASHRVLAEFKCEMEKRENETYAKLVVGDYQELKDVEVIQEIYRLRMETKLFAYNRAVEPEEYEEPKT